MADHMLAVSIEADGDDVHAFLHWGEMWNHLTTQQRGDVICAINHAMGDAIEDLDADIRAEMAADLVDRCGISQADALRRIEMAERLTNVGVMLKLINYGPDGESDD